MVLSLDKPRGQPKPTSRWANFEGFSEYYYWHITGAAPFPQSAAPTLLVLCRTASPRTMRLLLQDVGIYGLVLSIYRVRLYDSKHEARLVITY